MQKMAVFASGTGTNAQRIIEHFSQPSKKAVVALIVTNNPKAGVLKISEKAGIPLLIIEKETFFRGDGYVTELKSKAIDFVVLAGFLWKIPQTLIDAFPGRIINIHPALLPKYGGRGMYGSFVHQAVLEAKEPESGITIHYVDEHYDHGDIIFQARCSVHPGDDPNSLSERIHALEHEHYPIVIENVLNKLDSSAPKHH
jgi:phosphoribosylglycinamide formyltransferase-1